MKKIHDTKQLTAYVEKHNLQDYMDSDILAMASLHFLKRKSTSFKREQPQIICIF